MIGRMVRAEPPDGDLLVGVLLDLAAAESARGLAGDEPPEHQRRRGLLAAAAAVIDARRAQVEPPESSHDEVDQMIPRHPIAPIRRQQKRSVLLEVDEAPSHPQSIRE